MRTHSSATVDASPPLSASPRLPALRSQASAIVAGFLVVLVGYSGPVLIVREAALAAGLSETQAGSWLFAASFGSGIAGIVLSLWTRQPIIVAFSTAGVVLLTSSLGAYRFSDAVGAYVFVGLACVAIGLSSTFTALMARIPTPIVSAMLAGVLLRFGIGASAALGGAGVDGEPDLRITGVVLTMGAVFFATRARGSRLAIVWTALAGAAASFALGVTSDAPVELSLVDLEWTTPTLSPAAIVGLGLPLLVVALSAQYAPGYGVLKGAGYEPDMDRILAVTGGLGAGLGLLGGSGINLAAITAGLATGPDAHPDPTRRWTAGVWTGLFLIPVSLLGFSALTLFASLPAAFVAAVTGLGLFGPIVGAAAGALADDRHRDAAIATLLCAASGFSLFEVAAPFWALVIGVGLSALPARRASGSATVTPRDSAPAGR